MSTTIDQWRSAIGHFGGGALASGGMAVPGAPTQGIASLYVLITALILVYSNITAILLLRAGIEANPGPDQQNVSGR